MFRRRTPSPPAEPDPSVTGGVGAGGKGRPTPKRSEAEKARRQSVRPPKDRREASARQRAKLREERAAQRRAMLSGDERALPPRDAGPVRRYVRDYVDARRSAGEFFLPLAVVVFLLGLLRNPVIQLASELLFILVIATIVVDGFALHRGIGKGVRERFPQAQTRGLTVYALMRSLQLRRLRLPKPKVKPGDRI